MAIRLEKGENTKLDLIKFHVGLGWDVKNDETNDINFDLDVSAFMLGGNKTLLSDDYLVFYNSELRLKAGPTDKAHSLAHPLSITPSTFWSSNDEMRQTSYPVDPDLSVIGSIDDESGETSEDGDDETMDIDLSRVNPDIEQIIITVSIHDYKSRKQNFGQVERAYVRIYKPGQSEGEGEYIYDLSEDFSTCAAVEFCRLYRYRGEWKIQALGIGHRGGLEKLVEKYQ